MNKILISAFLSLCAFTAYATTETVVTVDENNNVVNVEQKEAERTFTIDTFSEADVNNNGCVDQKEAKDKGILNFHKYAKANKNCLNKEEYLRAMRGE